MVEFLYKNENDLVAADEISIEAFKQLKIEEIVKSYFDNTLPDSDFEKIGSNKTEVEVEEKDNFVPQYQDCYINDCKEVYINLVCPKDKSVMKISKLKGLKKGNNAVVPFPIYVCPTCQTNYTSLLLQANNHVINVGGNKYVNLSADKNAADYKKPGAVSAIKIKEGYGFVVEGKLKHCKNPVCSSSKLASVPVIVKDYSGNKEIRHIHLCNKCNAYMLRVSSVGQYEIPFSIVNEKDVEFLVAARQKKLEERRQRREAEREKKKQKLEEAKREREKIEEKKRQRQIRQQEELRRQKELQEQRKREIEEARKKQLVQDNKKLSAGNKNRKQLRNPDSIGVKDFVVKRNTFKCIHNEHRLQNIDAAITIHTKKGAELNTKVAAGYCPECDVFFIMESVYQRMKHLGVPMCRISDEKTYVNNSTNANVMRLAQESILMQYGYSVSKEEDLSETTRRKILALIVDNGILTRNDIIGYLDFFISQRRYQSRMEAAIDKWEADREFISEYKAGKYTEYGVNVITRRY